MSGRRSRKHKQAFAIRSEGGPGGLPRIFAAGGGPQAERIIELAGELGIAVHADPALVEWLAKLDVDSAIPPELAPLLDAVLNHARRLDQLAAPAEAPAEILTD